MEALYIAERFSRDKCHNWLLEEGAAASLDSLLHILTYKSSFCWEMFNFTRNPPMCCLKGSCKPANQNSGRALTHTLFSVWWWLIPSAPEFGGPWFSFKRFSADVTEGYRAEKLSWRERSPAAFKQLSYFQPNSVSLPSKVAKNYKAKNFRTSRQVGFGWFCFVLLYLELNAGVLYH